MPSATRSTALMGHQPRPRNTYEIAIGEAWAYDVLAVYQAFEAWLTNEGRPDLKDRAWEIMAQERMEGTEPMNACDKVRKLLEKPKMH